ncbi:rust resistance kinase Lr10-like [Olea europaea subsp. europaea]|uniref:Rust resistance kinase Lr10-like n=1 Tax=Olea europaea subsp. europaea TaxID=158383 RepID=A0A8S0PSN4_OLEEU|nr:rust resistance kinase Lr10-like [Olea europaea subsp. europaea]
MFIFLCYKLFFCFFPLLVVGLDDCTTTWCGEGGPSIRFPFRHKFLRPERCGYPGFNLYCNKSNETVLELPFSVKLVVTKIDYVSQKIQLHDPDGCLAQKLMNLSLSASHFHFLTDDLYDYSLFQCSETIYTYTIDIPCLRVPGYKVCAISSSDDYIDYYPLISCTKIHEISSVPWYILDGNYLYLKWMEPYCGHCEAQGKNCGLDATTRETQCTNSPKTHSAHMRRLVTGGTLGAFLLVGTFVALYYVYRSSRIKKEDHVKIEKFLEDYRAQKPTRFSYAEIRRITNQFSEKLGEGGYGNVYKGKLSNEIYVAVKVLNNSKGNGEEFINEVGTIGKIHHVNVVRLVGFCADGFRRALVYEFLPNDSLEKFIFRAGPTSNSLGWKKLQDIALGIAKGIEYLHQGCDQQILHFDIKPHNILLDHNFNPKVCDFGLAKLCSKEKSTVSITVARGTMGYIAPEVLSRNFGKVSYKSDVYSFGMLLLEMVGGRKNNDTTANTSQVYFPEWISNQLSQGEELHIRIEESDDATILKKLAIVGLWCIQWYPTDRPSMKVVVQMLEGDVDNLTMPPHPVPDTNRTNSIAGIRRRPHQIELAVISEFE